MRIVVAGATGTLGALVVDALQVAGHDAVPLNRSEGIDLMTGAGLAPVLRGADAVIDASATTGTSGRDAIAFFTATTTNLLQAEREAQVPHHVGISIVGAARIAAGYYAGKAAQEALLTSNRHRGWSLLRTTQFHEFAEQVVQRGRYGPLQVAPRMRSRPVAAAEVAAELVTLAAGDPRGVVPDLTGPREERMAHMVRRYLAVTGRRRPVMEIAVPGAWGRGMRDGSLLPEAGTRRASQTFEQWLAARSHQAHW